MTNVLQDARIGLRGLRRTPAFAVTAILTLGLGIGLATAVFTVADALLLRRLPLRDQDRVVVLWGEKRDGTFDNHPLGLDEARAFARRGRALERVGSFNYEGAVAVVVRNGDQISRMSRALVSDDFFGVLGARPVLGRALRPHDDVVGAAPVAVLSYAGWQRKFGGDSSVLGRRILTHIDGLSYTIVGVMPQGLDYPQGADFWASSTRTIPTAKLEHIAVYVVGRLARGATPTDARAELTAFFARADAPWWQRDLTGVVHTLPRLVLGETGPALIAFAAAAGLLLLITCVNVANLLLVRGLARVREVAVRSALGAGRGRIATQLLTENSILAIVGGAFGIVVAAVAVQTFVAFAPAAIPRLDEIGLNATALAGAVVITGIAMSVFALAPAVMTSRVDAQQVLRSGTRQSGGRRARRLTEGLVAGQVALALLVLSAAGLIARSLTKLQGAELSFDPSRLLVAELALRVDRFDNTTKQLALLEQLLPRLRATPGVRAASPVVAVPYSGSHGWDGRPALEGQSPEQAANNPMLNMELVAPDYFATLGIPVLQGRGFTDADREGAPTVVLLSRSAARRYWPGQNPIGKRLRFGSDLERSLTVVGVVPDTRYRDLRDARPSIYFPLRQPFFPYVPWVLAIRTVGPPGDMVPTVRRVVEETAPGVALANAAPFETYLARPLAQPRLNALLLAVFATAAVTLAAIGLFGVMATMVRQRTHELGVRMALGATARDLRRMVMSRGLTIAAAGSVAGLLAALLANRLLASMLYEVSPTDGATLGAVTIALLVVAGLASLIPARSSTRIDAMIALRADG
jgi:putative ABC transport system permease protein